MAIVLFPVDVMIVLPLQKEITAYPVRKSPECWPVRKTLPAELDNEEETGTVVLCWPVRKAPTSCALNDPACVPIPLPVRKKPEPKRSVIATVYSARSFYCSACESLRSFVTSRAARSAVRFNYSEPGWVSAYPTVVYTDGHRSDNGQHLRAELREM